ncbi:MAG: hypothetical protein ACE5EV_08990 [Gaiellales bacterium]
MKRLALLALPVLAAVGLTACGGGGGDGGGGLAQAPTASSSQTAPTAGGTDSLGGEEIGERRGLGGVSDSEQTKSAEPSGSTSSGANTPRVEDTSRPEAPVIGGETLDGAPISLEDFKGTPVVVKVFAES